MLLGKTRMIRLRQRELQSLRGLATELSRPATQSSQSTLPPQPQPSTPTTTSQTHLKPLSSLPRLSLWQVGHLYQKHGQNFISLISAASQATNNAPLFQACIPGFPGNITTIVSDINLLNEIYLEKDFYRRPPMPDFDFIGGIILGKEVERVGLACMDPPKWNAHRNIANKALMAPKAVKSYMDAMCESAMTQLVEPWKKCDGQVINTYSGLTNFTSRAILKAAFGFVPGDAMGVLTPQETRAMAYGTTTIVQLAGVVGMKKPLFWPADVKKRFTAAAETMRDVGRKIIAWKKEHPGSDFCSNLMGLKDDETGMELTLEEVLMDCLTVIGGGSDTTASHMGFVLHQLSRSPEVQERAYEEICALSQSDFDGKQLGNINEQQLKKLPYVEAIMNEIHRVFPISPAGGRAALKDTQLAGYFIPAHHHITINQIKLQLSPELWGTDAHEFNPSRWLDPARKTPPHPYAFLPFGAGARRCIGQRFSMQETRIAIAYIIQNFKLHYAGEMKLAKGILQVPALDHGVQVKIEVRK